MPQVMSPSTRAPRRPWTRRGPGLAGPLALLALAAAPATAQTWSDDFNRLPGTDLGPDWIETVGNMGIWNNRGQGFTDSFVGPSKMVHATAQGPYDQARVSVDCWTNPAFLTSVAVILGDGGQRNLYTLLEDGDTDGSFESLTFTSQDTGVSWGTNSFVLLAQPFQSAHLEVFVTNSGDTLNVEIDWDHDGTVDQLVQNSGILAFAGQLGTGFGIGSRGQSSFDDWVAEVPLIEGIQTSTGQLSLSAGGVQNMVLTAPAAHAGKIYVMLGSYTGTGFGFPVAPGVIMPLNPDAYFLFTLNTPNTPPLAGSLGVLDSQAQANASFTLPAGANPVLANFTLNHAFLVLDVLPTLLDVPWVSGPAPLQFLL